MLIGILAGGLYSLFTINVDSTPDITNNQVQVITVSDNLSTVDIEQFVTYPVELVMSNLPGVEDIRSVSRFGLSVVTIVFEEDMGTYLPRQLVQEKLEEVREKIPEGFGTPEMGPISTGLGEIYQYTLVPADTSEYTPQQLRTIQDWIVKRQLSMIPGVVEVNSFGGSIKQYEVSLNPDRLRAMKVSISEVFEALSKNNVNTGGAYIEKNHMANFIRGEGIVKSLEDIRHIVVKTVDGVPILIRDVADEVGFGSQVRYGAFTQDGHEAVGGMILMQKGANSGKVVAAVKERLKSVGQSLPPGLKIKPFLDRSDLIGRTTGTIARNLTEGALIVIFVLVLLLGNLRGGLITASVIPLSLLVAFILMRVFGVWANLMSLGAIDFGIIVDGAVIIVEGIVFETGKYVRQKQTALTGTEMDKISYVAASTMMHSAFFGQLIILIVFTPIFFLTGISGKMFAPMAYTFSFAVFGALLLCLTYIPMISSVMLRSPANASGWTARCEHRLSRLSNRMISCASHAYHPLLSMALRHKAATMLAAVGLFIASLFIFNRMGGEFIPELDEGDIAMQAFLRPGSSLSETIQREKEIEQLLLRHFPEIRTVCARIGVADIPTDPMGFDYTDSFIILEKDKSKWKSAKTKEELIEKMKEKLETLPGLNFSFSQPVALRFNELLTGVREDVAVKLYGEDLDRLNELGEQMVHIISRVPGANDVTLERASGLPQITISYDRQRLAQYGLQIEKLNQYVRAAFAGGSAGTVFEGEKRFDLVIRLSSAYRKDIEDLRNLYVDTPGGAQIPLGEVADIRYQSGPMQISRDRTSRHIYVGINVRGRDVESVVADIQKQLGSKLSLPAGYHLDYGGEFENLQDAKSRMMVVLPMAMLLIFVLLYFALKSFKQSLMIFMAVPLAAIGGILALWLRGMPFSISASVGFIVLFGVAVLNGLVLINRFNALKQEGMSDINRRIFIGTRERLRPILLTATAAMFGFFPMSVSSSAGAEVQRPLATVVIGGLLTATLLTLVIVPVLYAWEERLHRPHIPRPHLKLPVWMAVSVAATVLSLLPQRSAAQQKISLEQAIAMAEQFYPTMKEAQLGIEREEAIRKGGNEAGLTEFASGAEELGRGNTATVTVLSVRQNLNLLGNHVRNKSREQSVRTARAAARLATFQLRKSVSQAYLMAYIAGRKLEVYTLIDSIYQHFEHAAKVKYDSRETSHLEYLTARKKAFQTAEDKRQAADDYHIAVLQLSQWLGTGTFEPADAPDTYMQKAIADSTGGNPLVAYYAEQVKSADADIRLERTKMLPSFYVEGGSQMIGSRRGYWVLNVGMSLPIFQKAYRAREKAIAIDRDIAQTRLDLQRTKTRTELQRLHAEHEKWQRKLQFYRDIGLPTAREQRRGAEAAYRLGATDYVGFIQTMADAVQTELDYWTAYEEMMNTQINIQYPSI